MEYSYRIGLWKGLKSVIVYALGFAAVAAFAAGVSERPIADLIYEALKNVLGGLTVGGLITFVLNWVKHR